MPWTRRRLLATAAAMGTSAYLGCRGQPRAHGHGPNVLVLIVDSLRADQVYGSLAQTPNMDALAREGLRFTQVFPEAMPTVPVRNAILSGRRTFPFRDWHDHRGLIAKPGWEPLEDVESAFSSVLRRSGWWTAYVTDNPFLGWSAPYEPVRRSFDVFTRIGGQIGGRDRAVAPDRLRRWMHPALLASERERVRRYISNADYADDESRSFAARVFTAAIEALDTAARRRPFLLIADTYQPHEPWTPPRSYTRLYGDPGYSGPEPPFLRYARVDDWLEPGEADMVLERLRIVYQAEVTMTDRWLGALLDRLHLLDLERDTVVVLVGDHGILLGEHGWTGKISTALHPELIQVPLIIVDPARRSAGEPSAYYASTHDLGRTILALTGVRPPAGMEGNDLSSIFNGEAPPVRSVALGGYANSHFVRNARWAYSADNRFLRPRLFDLMLDPSEATDVAADNPAVVAEMRAHLAAEVGEQLPYYE